MRRRLILLPALLFGLLASSQNSAPSLPQVLPPTPEASAIVKEGQLSAGLFTGAAHASIPLYTIKVGGMSIPVGLNYSSNGTRVDEIPSRVGLGWIISPSGVITRNVNGRPDDLSTRTPTPTTNLTETQWVQYYDGLVADNQNGDNQPDEFSISAPGLGGKFYINNQGVPVFIDHSNVKVTVIGGGGSPFSEFIVTNTDGTRYRFGGTGAIETTITHNVSGLIISRQQIRTGFFLKTIELINGESVTFNYSSINFVTYPGISQSIRRGVPENLLQSCVCNNTVRCPGPSADPSTFVEQVAEVRYNSVYLTSVQTSNYINVSFFYQPRPDASEDKRLTSIGINAGGFNKIYSLDYVDPQTSGYGHANGTINKRFFLSRIYSVIFNDNGPITSDTLSYTFDYENLNFLPPRLSFSQDNLGFFNGQSNASLLPVVPGEQQYWGTYATADRQPTISSKNGMLRRITFPTGGYEEYEFEQNTYAKYEQLNTTETKSVTGSGTTSRGGSYQAQVYYSPSFNILQNQSANLSFSVYPNPGCSSCSQPPANTVDLAKVEVETIGSGVVVYSELLRDNGTITSNIIPLTAGNSYRLKLTVWGSPNAAISEIRYDYAAAPQNVWVNKPSSGIRISKITSYDPVTAQSTSVFYRYAKKVNLGVSSGKTLFSPSYIEDSDYRIDCGEPDVTICIPPRDEPPGNHLSCKFKLLASNTAAPLYMFDNNHVGYEYVVESNDAEFKNGCVEHKYALNPIINRSVIMGYEVKSLPNNTVSNINGAEIETTIYNKAGIKIKESATFFSTDANGMALHNALAIRRRYSNTMFNNTTPSEMLHPFDVTQYQFQTYWYHPDSTVTMEYDADNTPFKSKQVFYYGAATNIKPIKTETYSSTGEVLSTEMKYPTDFVNTSPYIKMVDRNIISPIVETRIKKATQLISKIRTEYIDWYPYNNANGPVIIAPKRIFSQKGNNVEECNIQYFAYDITGNPLEVAKENGSRISYLWDYNNSFSIAEIRNASITTDSIAYTSFEYDSKGNWVFSGSTLGESTAPTGLMAYSLANGAVSRVVSSLQNYILTVWVKNNSGTISVGGFTAKQLIERNGWKCYEYRISSTTSVTVSGTAIIDELRLFPAGSFMTTMTYSPHVGITSKNGQNNQIVYYYYDLLGRLIQIRDADHNIVKQNDYKYNQTILPCPNTSANWQPTGIEICDQSGTNNNYTGNRLREERDMNNCSPTYLQKRWYNIGTNASCTPVANCSGADKRVVINGGVAVCETGKKILVSSIQNGPNSWTCTYHYVWTDGYTGPDFTESSSTGCSVFIPEQ